MDGDRGNKAGGEGTGLTVAIVGEGSRDYGRGEEAKGALMILVERILNHPPGVCFEGRPLPRLHGRGGLRKKARLAIVAACMRGDAGLAIVVDNDRQPPGRRLQDIRKGVDESEAHVPYALGVAIESFEAWMLADERALFAVLHPGKTAERQPDPEEIGKPKQAINEIAGRRVTGSDLAQIAERADLDLIAKRCRRGFARFRKEVKDNLGTLCEESN